MSLSTEIINWKELKEHFGMEKAKELSKKLLKEVNADDFHNLIAVSYELGFFATFSLVERKQNKLFYEFTGTAG